MGRYKNKNITALFSLPMDPKLAENYVEIRVNGLDGKDEGTVPFIVKAVTQNEAEKNLW
jgi:hypothetical protein